MIEESYYAAVESHFVARRGSPLFITPAEWQLVWKWEQAGIPLRVVQEGIDRVFERPKTARKARKLGYCRQTVEAAFRRFREARLGESVDGVDEARDPELDVAAHLRELSDSLSKLAAQRAGVLASRSGEASAELRKLAAEAASSSFGEVEDRLAELESALIDAAASVLADAEREQLRREAEATLADYRERMPDHVYEAAVASGFRRRLRDRLELPRLTLLDR